MSQEFSFTLPYDAFDLELIGLGAEDVGSSDFSTKVSEFFARQFAKFGGKARVVLNDTARTIQVTWSKAEGFQEPLDMALSLLRSGRLSEAIPLLWTLHQKSPSDTDLLYNLGVAHSELGQIPRAIDVLKRLTELAPNHVHGLVALGIAYIRAEKLQFGEDHLRRALEQEPGNPWALKNLGACLLKQGRFEDAVPILEEAVRVSPKDLQAILGLGQAYEDLGRIPEADDRYLQAIQIGGPPALTEFAKERRTAIAHEVMRDRSEFRPDVVMYMVSGTAISGTAISGTASITMYLSKPLLSLLLTTIPDGAEAGNSHGSDTTELENGAFHLIVAWHPIYPAIKPRWGIHGDKQVSCASRKQPIPKRGAFTKLEGEPRKEHAVNVSLE